MDAITPSHDHGSEEDFIEMFDPLSSASERSKSTTTQSPMRNPMSIQPHVKKQSRRNVGLHAMDADPIAVPTVMLTATSSFHLHPMIHERIPTIALQINHKDNTNLDEGNFGLVDTYNPLCFVQKVNAAGLSR